MDQDKTNKGSDEKSLVFISYAREDEKAARRLYNDLKSRGLNPWLDKESLLPGQNWENEIEAAISKSRYFIPLFSKTSVTKIGYVQSEFKFALDVFRRYPPNMIFYIPIRLDDCQIPYKELKSIHRADLFPVDDNMWNEGVDQILRAIGITSEYDKKDHNHNSITMQPSTSDRKEYDIFSIQNIRSSQKLKSVICFRGEKQTFVGRQEYIDKIKENFNTRGSHLSIWGPGGSGKSQLAFKAIHQCEEQGIFDLVIPVYFDIGLITFSEFISLLVKSSGVGISIQDFEKQNIEERNGIISNLLNQKKHPLIFVDSYETISSVLNNPAVTNPSDEVVQINYFLNNNLPPTTSILLTSREKNNLDVETRLELEGLKEQESRKLFTTLVREDYLKKPTGTVHSTIDALLKKTGGHPLSIEIIAKNITSIDEVEEVSQSLGVREANRGEPNERLKSLRNSFDYTINKLGKQLKDLLFKLTVFKSPFPISAPVKIFGIDKHDITELHNRSLLTRVESDDAYGKIEEPLYWLYKFHPATRNYVEDELAQMTETRNFYNVIQIEYGERYVNFYLHLLHDIFTSIIKEDKEVPDKIRRFSIIFEGENNDFERALILTNKSQIKSEISTLLGSILDRLGLYSKALEYHKKSNDINIILNDRAGIAKDYLNIGWLFSKLHDYKQALDYHRKALSEYDQLHDKIGISRENSYIGLALSKLGRHQEALEYHGRAIAIDEEFNNNKWPLAEDYQNMASTFYDMGEYNKALEYYMISLDKYNKIGLRLGPVYCHSGLGRTYEAMGNHREALNHHHIALDMRKHMGYKTGIAAEYYYISFVFFNKQQKDEALKSLIVAKCILEEFERQTGYRHPLLSEVQERLSSLQIINSARE